MHVGQISHQDMSLSNWIGRSAIAGEPKTESRRLLEKHAVCATTALRAVPSREQIQNHANQSSLVCIETVGYNSSSHSSGLGTSV